MRQNKIYTKLFFAILLAAGLPNCAFASGAPAILPLPDAQADNWQFELSPYIWGAGLSGSTKVGRMPTTDVDVKPTDLMKYLNAGFMAAFEMRKNRFGVFADAIYVKLSKSLPTNFDRVAANAGVTQQVYSLAGNYRIIDNDYFPLDLFVGARYVDLQMEISIDPVMLILPRGFSVDDKLNWWDGYTGLRLQYAINKKWKLVAYGDVGTGGSKISWQGLAGINYAFTKNFVGKIGYRILSEDYDNDKVVYDMRMGGFYLGFGIGF